VIAASAAIGTIMVIGLSVAWARASRPATIAVTPRSAPPHGDAIQ
jgi:hypothetical protein